MDLSLNTSMHPLSVIAGVLAVVSLLLAVLFVHERRQRLAGILLSVGLLCLIAAPMFGSSAVSVGLTGIATALVLLSAFLNIRLLRTRSN